MRLRCIYLFSLAKLITDDFYAYKDDSSYDIKVFYVDSQGNRIDTIVANTDQAPAVVEYNTRLYIFWRDRTTHAVKYSYYTSSGWRSGVYDLNSKSITANGSFDVAVFNNKLYIIAAAYSSDDVFLARCDTSICTDSSWHDFDETAGTDYINELGYDAFHGMGAVAINGLNGASSGEHLYVVSRSTSFSRIRIDQVGTDEEVDYTYNMPTHYPSYKAIGTIGVKAMISAFPSTGKHFHFAWSDSYTGDIYYSAVQRWDDVNDEYTWVTRSADSFLGGSEGVRLMKGDGESAVSLHLSYLGAGGLLAYAYRYGRY